MTAAICFKCGEMKFGAWCPCPKCGALPESDDDLALSFAMSDHHFDTDALRQLGRCVAEGKPPALSADDKAAIIEMMRKGQTTTMLQAMKARPAETTPDVLGEQSSRASAIKNLKTEPPRGPSSPEWFAERERDNRLDKRRWRAALFISGVAIVAAVLWKWNNPIELTGYCLFILLRFIAQYCAVLFFPVILLIGAISTAGTTSEEARDSRIDASLPLTWGVITGLISCVFVWLTHRFFGVNIQHLLVITIALSAFDPRNWIRNGKRIIPAQILPVLVLGFSVLFK
jgi:hypothetical protein